jgi:hypothetical protein
MQPGRASAFAQVMTLAVLVGHFVGVPKPPWRADRLFRRWVGSPAVRGRLAGRPCLRKSAGWGHRRPSASVSATIPGNYRRRWCLLAVRLAVGPHGSAEELALGTAGVDVPSKRQDPWLSRASVRDCVFLRGGLSSSVRDRVFLSPAPGPDGGGAAGQRAGPERPRSRKDTIPNSRGNGASRKDTIPNSRCRAPGIMSFRPTAIPIGRQRRQEPDSADGNWTAPPQPPTRRPRRSSAADWQPAPRKRSWERRTIVGDWHQLWFGGSMWRKHGAGRGVRPVREPVRGPAREAARSDWPGRSGRGWR